MEEALGSGEALATDAAEYLVERGVPFREAHEAVGKAAAFATAAGRPLAALTAAEWKGFHRRFERDVLRCFDPRRSLRRRELPGGPGPRQVTRGAPALGEGARRAARRAERVRRGAIAEAAKPHGTRRAGAGRHARWKAGAQVTRPLAALGLAAVLAGCGMKGPPRPPARPAAATPVRAAPAPAEARAGADTSCETCGAARPRRRRSGGTMNHFQRKRGVLHAEGIPLEELARAHGTPLYVYSTATLTRHWKVLHRSLSGLDHQVHYAVKANSNLAVLSLLARLGCGLRHRLRRRALPGAQGGRPAGEGGLQRRRQARRRDRLRARVRA